MGPMRERVRALHFVGVDYGLKGTLRRVFGC